MDIESALLQGAGAGSGGGHDNPMAPLEPGQVVTEVDAWDRAMRALQSGLTPEEVHLR